MFGSLALPRHQAIDANLTAGSQVDILRARRVRKAIARRKEIFQLRSFDMSRSDADKEEDQ
jgi:hypothetical protein